MAMFLSAVGRLRDYGTNGSITIVHAVRVTRTEHKPHGGILRKLMLKMSISMDGFCADSDPSGPQKWLFDTADDESNAWELSFLRNAGYHAMGHNTYRVMAGFWPVSTDSFSDLMNSIPKLVFTGKGLDADDALITPRAVEAARKNPSGQSIPSEEVIRG